MKINELKHDPRNPRKHNKRNLDTIALSLQELGAARSIVIDENNQILAGNGVIQAAGQVGLENVQVVDADGQTIIAVRRKGLTDKQKKRMAVYDNQAGVLAEWDAEVMAALTEDDPEMVETIFSDQEWNEILKELGADKNIEDPGAEISKADELCEKWQVKSGQLWQLGDHRVICGDCTDHAVVERVMGGEKAGAVVTDSPYGINQAGIENDNPEGLRKLFDGCLSAMPIENAIIINFQSPRLFPVWLDALREAGQVFERMLWMYKPSDETFPWRGWLLTSEAILISSTGKGEWLRVDPFAHDCYSPTTIGKELDKSQGWHASVKPIAVIQDLISRVGGLVFDPFLGSGTTLIACERLGRRCRGIEISPGYVAVTIERWASATKLEPVLLGQEYLYV